MTDIDTLEIIDLPSPRIALTMPGGREITSSGAPGMTAEALASSVIEAGIVPEGTPWREVDEEYTTPPTVEELQAQFTAAIQTRLDTFAQTRNYDNALACATYATSTNAKFAREGQYMVETRDATWAKGYEILDAATSSGSIPTWENVVAQLPVLTWPDEPES